MANVQMKAPDSDEIATTTQDAFDSVWSKKGFTLVEPEEAARLEQAAADYDADQEAEQAAGL